MAPEEMKLYVRRGRTERTKAKGVRDSSGYHSFSLERSPRESSVNDSRPELRLNFSFVESCLKKTIKRKRDGEENGLERPGGGKRGRETKRGA